MEKEHSCIICGRPTGHERFIGSIKDIGVSFCRKHVEECKQNCDNCIHASTCPSVKPRPAQAL